MTAALQVADAWKPCDLRGVYPEAVSPELCRAIGGAVATLLNPASRVLVGGDFRHSTPDLKRALSEGLHCAGAHVLDAGQLPTPVAYFAACESGADAMLMVTASHNPPTHNGLKLMLGSMPMTPEQLLEIRALTESRAFRIGTGRAENIDPRPAYTAAMTKRGLICARAHLPALCSMLAMAPGRRWRRPSFAPSASRRIASRA